MSNNNAANSSTDESSSAGQNATPSLALTDALLKHEMPCETKDGDKIFVRVSLLLQSKKFKALWEDLNIATFEQLEDFNFPVKDISTSIFAKVVDWMGEHDGKPVPVIEEDPATHERKWFILTEWESNFFKVDTEEMSQMLVAGKSLDIPSLYLIGAQSVAVHLKTKTAEEIRELFGLEEELTEEEKADIKKKNVWPNN